MSLGDRLMYSQFLTTDTIAPWAPIASAGMFQAQTDLLRASTWMCDQKNDYDVFGMSNPTIPALDIAQFSINQCKNKWNQNGTNFGPFNFDGLNFNSPFIFNPSGSLSSSSSNTGNTELDTTTDFLNKVLTLAKDSKSGVKIKPALKKEIDEALKTTGSNDEKLDAMKAVINKIPEGVKTKILYAMNSEELSSIGYEFKNSNDKDIKNFASSLHDKYASNLKPDTCTSGEVEGLVAKINSEGSTKILTAISYWNTKYNSSGCILGDIVKELSIDDFKDDTAKETLIDKQIKPLVNVMLGAAQEEIENLKNDGYDVSDLESKREALNTANNALTKSAFTKDKFDAVVSAFKDMYAALRINLANKVDKDIQDQYGFLNTSTKKNFQEHLILDKTKEDLEAEGISASGVTPGERTEDPDDDEDDDEFSDGTDIDSDLEILTSTEGGKTPSLEKKTAGSETYYVTKEGPADAKRYYYKDGNKIKEIKNAKSVAANGTITFQDNSTNSIAEYKTAHRNDNEVKPEVIKETNKSLKKAAALVADGKLEVLTKGNSQIWVTAGDSKFVKDKRYHYYTINADGKLCEIKYKDNPNLAMSTFNGNTFNVWQAGTNGATYNGTSSQKNYPADFSLVEASESDIKSKVQSPSEITPTTLQELKDLGTPVSGKNSNGCTITDAYKIGNKYYRYNRGTGKVVELTGFTETGAGTATQQSGNSATGNRHGFGRPS